MSFKLNLFTLVSIFITFGSTKGHSEERGEPIHYVFLGGDALENNRGILSLATIQGVQRIYRWRMLEPAAGSYDFSSISEDLKLAREYGKGLFIQIQDRTFTPQAIPVPDYLLTDEYEGGMVKQADFQGPGVVTEYGWVAKQWNFKVRQRFQRLLTALGQEFDGKVAGINLPETSIDPMEGEGFSCDGYFTAVMDNMQHLKKEFQRSQAVQYVNFFPCEWNNDQTYMQRVFELAADQGIGLGNPDTIPHRRGQMKNSYPFFHAYEGRVFAAIAVQSPVFNYRNPSFTVDEIYDFSRSYLGSDLIFWTKKEPQFSELILPLLLR